METRVDAPVITESFRPEEQFVSDWEAFLVCGKSALGRRGAELYGPLTENWLLEQPDAVKEQLSIVFMKFLESLSGKRKVAEAQPKAFTLPSKSRADELLWLENNKDILRALVNNWVAIEGDQLIAASADFSVVLEETRKQGIKVPFMVYVPSEIDINTISL